jgi:hypothetical protein
MDDQASLPYEESMCSPLQAVLPPIQRVYPAFFTDMCCTAYPLKCARWSYTRHLDPDVPSPVKRNTQNIERKHLTLRTRM